MSSFRFRTLRPFIGPVLPHTSPVCGFWTRASRTGLHVGAWAGSGRVRPSGLSDTSASAVTGTTPLKDADRIFTNLYGRYDPFLRGAKERGIYHRTKDLIELGRAVILSELKKSSLRGRGGAGFPSGLKYSFMPTPKPDGPPNFLLVNADEGEPGTCKDREILRHDPHRLIEGALLVGVAMQAHKSYIVVRGEFFNEAQTLQRAIYEAYDGMVSAPTSCPRPASTFYALVAMGLGVHRTLLHCNLCILYVWAISSHFPSCFPRWDAVLALRPSCCLMSFSVGDAYNFGCGWAWDCRACPSTLFLVWFLLGPLPCSRYSRQKCLRIRVSI